VLSAWSRWGAMGDLTVHPDGCPRPFLFCAQ
jgi:hypothetical protein